VFKVEAHDGVDIIGRGRRELFVINRKKTSRPTGDKETLCGF
jgi:predicted thioesterase